MSISGRGNWRRERLIWRNFIFKKKLEDTISIRVILFQRTMLVLSRVFKRTFYSIFGKQTRIDIYYIEGRDLYKNDSNKTSFHPIKLLEQRGKKAREKEIWIHIFAIVRCLSIANTLPNNTRIFLFTCPLSILHNLQKNGGKNNSCYRTTPFDCKFTFIYLSIVDCVLRNLKK